MSPVVPVEASIRVGIATTLEGPSPSRPISTVFEDDGETGYFYALEHDGRANPIVDAMAIYRVTSIVDKERPYQIRLCWSSDGLKSGLLINGFLHAVFDFAAKRGYCRTNFPPSGPG